jgi:hypothetical protein
MVLHPIPAIQYQITLTFSLHFHLCQVKIIKIDFRQQSVESSCPEVIEMKIISQDTLHGAIRSTDPGPFNLQHSCCKTEDGETICCR